MEIALQDKPEQATQPASTSALLELIRELHKQRQLLDTARTVRVEAEQAFRKDNPHIFETEEALEAIVKDLDSAIRKAAVEEYEANSGAGKQICAGVSIAVSATPIYDASKAFEWAREHKMCLIPESLDIKAFAAMCKQDATRPSFVIMKSVPSARIDSNLDKAVATLEKAGN
jgi:hypothetical protein